MAGGDRSHTVTELIAAGRDREAAHRAVEATASRPPQELRRRLGLVDALAAHPEGHTIEQLAATLGLDASYALVILRAAFEAEVVDREGDRDAVIDGHT